MVFATSSNTETGLWKLLNEKTIPPTKLASLLWLFMETGLANDSKLVQIECGATAATAYMYLSSIQGANAFKFFHGFLVQKAVELWRLAFRVLVHGARSVEEMTEHSTKGKKKKGKKDEDDDAPVHNLLPRANMRDILMNATGAIYVFLGKVALAGLDNCALSISDFTRDIARIDCALKDPRTTEANEFLEFIGRKRLDERSFALMHCLAHGRHGEALVYERCVLPRIMLWSWENMPYASGAMPMSIVHYGDSMMRWLERRMEKHNVAEMECVDEILYAIFSRCPDRSDYRSRLPTVFVNLLLKSPREKQYEFRAIIWDHSVKSNMLPTIIEVCALMIEKMDWSGGDSDHFNVTKKKLKRKQEEEVKENENKEQEKDSEMNKDDDEDVSCRHVKKEKKDQQEKNEQDGSMVQVPPGANVLFRILVDGCTHSSSAVRMRSLHLVGTLLKDIRNHMMIVNVAYELIHAISAQDDLLPRTPAREEATRESRRQSIAMAGGNPLFAILECTSRDFKSQVRKAAVMCIANFLPHAAEESFHVGMMILQKACRDEAQVVRRQAAESITGLLSVVQQNYWHYVADVWINEVFPMIGDAETVVAEMVAGLVLELVLQPLLDSHKAVEGLAAEVLSKVYAGSSSRSDLIRALKDQATHHKLKASVVTDVQNKLMNPLSNETHLWTLLDCLLRVFPNKADVSFIFNKWFAFTRPPFSVHSEWQPYPTIPYGSLAPTLLGMIRLVEKKFSMSDRQKLIENLEAHVIYNSVPTEFLNEMWLTIAILHNHQKDGDIKMESEHLRRFASKCYRHTLKILKSIWSKENLFEALKMRSLEESEAYLCRLLTSCSLAAEFNLSLIYLLDGEEAVDLNEPLLVSYLLKVTTSCYSDLRDNLGRRRTDLGLLESANTSLVVPPMDSNGRYVLHADWQRLRRCRSDTRVVFRTAPFPDRVRAAAAAALGVHCLLDGELARDYLPELIKEMQGCPNSTVRLNLLVPCCDMVKRYPSMAEELSPRLGTMLLDPHPLLRSQALEMLTHLIKEQFVKWEGVVMHIYTIMCVDANAKTASFAQNALKNALLPIMEDMLYSNFMEFLLYYNNAPFVWNDADGLIPHQREKVCLLGTGSSASRFVWRQTIIRFLLSTFNDQQRFGSMVRMCTDIIHPVTTGKLDIEDPVISSLLNDCLELMSCEEMDIAYTFGKRNPDEGVPVEDDEPTDAVQEKVKEAIMMAFRKGIEQRILPVLFELLSLSEKKRLGAFARKTTFTIEMLCKDHVEYVEEMLKALNPHMAPELIREMKSENGFLQTELSRRRRDKEQLRMMHITASQRRDPVMPMNTPRVRRGSIIVGTKVEQNIEDDCETNATVPINQNAVVAFNDIPMTSPVRNSEQQIMDVPRSILRKSIRCSMTVRDECTSRVMKRKNSKNEDLSKEGNEKMDPRDKEALIQLEKKVALEVVEKCSEKESVDEVESVQETEESQYEQISGSMKHVTVDNGNESEMKQCSDENFENLIEIGRQNIKSKPITEEKTDGNKENAEKMKTHNSKSVMKKLISQGGDTLKQDGEEQKKNETQSDEQMRTPERRNDTRKCLSMTSSATVDETVYGGRAFSTPKTSSDNADLTFFGLDMSVIQHRTSSEQPK